MSKVYDPLGDGISEISLTDVSGSDAKIVRMARVSYGNDTMDEWKEGDEKLIRYMVNHRHGSPFEHTMLTFKVKAPLYVVQEMLRHRHLSFNQESARYVVPSKHEESIMKKFYIPQVFRLQDTKNRQSSFGELEDHVDQKAKSHYFESCVRSWNAYQRLIDLGVCREQARGVLPHSTYASLYITCNVRSLLHFVGLRSSPDAQWEIRQYSDIMLEEAEKHFPVSVKAFKDNTEK